MARNNNPADTVKVATIPPRPNVRVGKPGKIVTANMRMKTAFPQAGGTTLGSGGNFYSPELSTDFLELPQTVDEQRNFYRFFYDHDEFVGQAIDLNSELPLSKIRLRMPEAKNREIAEKSMRFCQKWSRKVGLLHRLISIVHDFHLIGEAFVFCEDTSPDMPEDVRSFAIREVNLDGTTSERWVEYEDADERAVRWLKKNYKGWSAVRVLPPEQIHMESFPFTDAKLLELVVDSKTKAIVNKAQQGDPRAIQVVETMPREIVSAVILGQNLPLNTDPDAGSFCYHMARKKSDYEPRGKSLLQRCLLPGTPIWVNRNGVIQQVAVEDVDTSTDELLTHKGRFRKATAGSRPVREDVTVLSIEGIERPLALTSDHEVLRVSEDGREEWVESGKLREGDLVREAHVISEAPAKTEIDLAEWWAGRTLATVKRGREVGGAVYEEAARSLDVAEVDVDPHGLTVTVEYAGDNRGQLKTGAVAKMSKLLGWFQSLSEPTEATIDGIMGVTGLTYNEVRSYSWKFRRELGLKSECRFLGKGKGKVTTWWPLSKDLRAPGAVVSRTETSPFTKIEITEDFCYLLGTWLGDGCVWTSDDTLLNTHSVGWALHDTEPEIRDRIHQLVGDVFGSENIISGALIGKGSEEEGSQSIRIEDMLLARWFQEEFGHTAQGKHLPEWVFGLPETHLLALLRGLLDTDGSLTVGRASQIGVVLDNPLLIEQIHLICNRVGIQTQVVSHRKKAHSWARRWKTKKGWKEKTYNYEAKTFSKLSCSRHDSVLKWARGSVKGDRIDWPERKAAWSSRFNEQGWLTRKIKSVETAAYEGLVYSFDVGGDKSHATLVVTHNCLRTLVFRDKVRQALTSIASRHMTPFRLIWADDMDDAQTEDLRQQVDIALQDPDYSIISNFQVNWEEMGADQRLPNWDWVYEQTNRQMYAGLGVTESLLSGESSYSGDRIHLEVINTRFMLLREVLQDFVEDYIFKPMCARMGFVEEDEDGNLEVITPRLSFTRLALRDNQETFDALFNLYQKGSLDLDVILDLLNIDPITTRDKLEKDRMTIQDSLYNEILRSAYSTAGNAIPEQSDMIQKLIEDMGLKFKPPAEGEGRY